MIRDIQKTDNNDIIEIKRAIKQMLISDRDILEALNNHAIPLDSPDEFLDKNIFGYVRIPGAQDTVRNFICIAVNDIEPRRNSTGGNTVTKKQQVSFNIICHMDDMKTEYGIDRHDLISWLIEDRFGSTDQFGFQFSMYMSQETTVDTDYYCRVLTFQATKLTKLNKGTKSNKYEDYQ